MYNIAIEYVKKDYDWIVSDLQCLDMDRPLHGVMSLIGTVRMLAFHNIDIAWRWFEKTKCLAEEVADSIDDPDICRPESELLNVELIRPTSTQSLTSLEQ